MQTWTSPTAPLEIWVCMFVRDCVVGRGRDSYRAVIRLAAEGNWDSDGAGVAGCFGVELPKTGVDFARVECCSAGAEGDAEEVNGGGGGEMHCGC